MSPEFVCVYGQASVTEALERVQRSSISADSLAWVFVMNSRKRLVGAIALADLLRADSDGMVADIAEVPQRVRPDADIEEVARLMTDYDLTVVPVTDAEGLPVGVVTVDDVLELTLPRGWRRRFGLLGEE
jgi:Mg/Co/Ni transporter MgtE